jgi:HAD superfamily hydrolase (TIGR01490 family)
VSDRAPDAGTSRKRGALTLFDLDHTLLPIDSDHAWGEFMTGQGWVDGPAFRRGNDAFYADYKAGRLDIDAYIAFAVEPLRRQPPEALAQAHARFMREVIGPALRPAAHALVRAHRDRGDRIALVTSTNEFITAPVAAALGIETLLATRLQRGPDGRLTGRIDGIAPFREGKPRRVRQWLAESGADWASFERISVYGDSPNDVPLLECATDPVATNPSPELRAIAEARGWRILNLFE